jgi:hypothetical protein
MCVLPVLQKLLTGAARALFTDGSPLTFSPPPPPLSLPPPFHSPLSLSLPLSPPLPLSPSLSLSPPLSPSLYFPLLPSISLHSALSQRAASADNNPPILARGTGQHSTARHSRDHRLCVTGGREHGQNLCLYCSSPAPLHPRTRACRDMRWGSTRRPP